MTYQLIKASAHATGLPDKSVHCIVTSPPYYGLRAYAGDQMIEWPTVRYSPMPGLPEITIQGCEPGCVHEWSTRIVMPKHNDDGIAGSTLGGGKSTQAQAQRTPITQDVCIHCGGWRGGLGNEPQPEAFIGHLILVMREMWRVLRDDGTAWINLSDSYNGSGGAGGDYGPGGSKEGQPKFPGRKVGTSKTKDMLLIPQRFVLAAQAAGWYVRSVMPWLKRNGMPDSCTDRPSQVVESILLLAKSEKYYFDMESVKQPATNNDTRNGRVGAYQNRAIYQNGDGTTPTGAADRDLSTRNFRSSDLFFKTWQGLVTSDDGEPLAMVVNTNSYGGAHFATWPLDLVEPMIKASTSAHGVCPQCGSSWARLVEKKYFNERAERRGLARGEAHAGQQQRIHNTNGQTSGIRTKTTSWQPTCTCGAGEPIPATVCDPFNGSGTTGRAALQLNRSYIGIDVSQEYLEDLAPERLSNVQIELALA